MTLKPSRTTCRTLPGGSDVERQTQTVECRESGGEDFAVIAEERERSESGGDGFDEEKETSESGSDGSPRSRVS